MVFLEVEVPVLGQVYDFKVERKARVERIISGMADQICQKENCDLDGKEEQLLLWDMEQERILPRDWLLEECNIKTGTRLLLV